MSPRSITQINTLFLYCFWLQFLITKTATTKRTSTGFYHWISLLQVFFLNKKKKNWTVVNLLILLTIFSSCQPYTNKWHKCQPSEKDLSTEQSENWRKQNITFMSAEADSSGGTELRFLSLQLMKLPKFIQKKSMYSITAIFCMYPQLLWSNHKGKKTN